MKIINYIITLSLIFIIFSCDTDSPYISNDIDSVLYNADFKSTDSGEEKYSVNLSWNKYTGDEVIYEIFDEENTLIESITSKNDTTLSINMSLNEIKIVSLSVNGSDYGQIKIFTKPVTPTINLAVNATSESSVLSWTQSSDDDIQATTVYRSEVNPSSGTIPLINDSEGTPDEGLWTIIKQGNSSLSSYTDNSINTSLNYYYTVKVIDGYEGYRYSYIRGNISGSAESVPVLGVSNGYQFNLQSSEDIIDEIYADKTSFFWQDYNYDDFYEFQIWRSENETFQIESSESVLISTITNPTIASFEDYNDIGENKTWYYRLRLNNIYGNFIDSEIITCNTSLE